MTRKLIIHDGRAERELVLVGTITVGRDPGCHINDLDPLLSRRHAEFVTTLTGCTVRDLGSRNGMLVNGEKIREHRLAAGDLIQLGHLQLRYDEVKSVVTPEAIKLSNATTAHAPAMSAAAASPAALDDTKPHPHHDHAGHPDDDATRVPSASKKDHDATRAPSVNKKDDDATVAPRGAAAPAKADDEDTMAPVGKRPAAVSLDATIAPGTLTDFDATVILGAAVKSPASVPAADFDATFAPGAVDLDATFVPGMARAQAVPAIEAPTDARLNTGVDLRITAATPGCREMFGVAPESLVGRPLGEVLVERLKAASATGASEVTLVVDRTGPDRSLTVVVKAAQPVETVS